MHHKSFAAGLLMAAFASSALSATSVRGVYETASFVEIGTGLVELEGFGRGVTNSALQPLSFSAAAATRVNFFDTWNIQTAGVAAGTYSFSSLVIDATGGLLFGTSGFAVTFNSIDEAGVRQTVLFDVNADGTQAVGSGTFTVRSNCPVASCVWIDLTGTQELGAIPDGYGGVTIAALVPEPSSYALMALGLLAVVAAARRKARASA